jgi:hypothetical protein
VSVILTSSMARTRPGGWPFTTPWMNNGAISQAKQPRSHEKNEHVHHKFHLMRQFVNDGDIKMCKIHTNLNVSDPLAKPMTLAKHEQHRNTIGVRVLNFKLDY